MSNDQSTLDFANLPEEIITTIFSFFKSEELVKISEVNKRFNRISQDEQLWQLKCQEEGINLEKNETSYKQAYISYKQTFYFLCQFKRVPASLDKSSWYIEDGKNCKVYYKDNNFQKVMDYLKGLEISNSSYDKYVICQVIIKNPADIKNSKLSITSYTDCYYGITYEPQALQINLNNTLSIFKIPEKVSIKTLGTAVNFLDKISGIIRDRVMSLENYLYHEKNISAKNIFSAEYHKTFIKPLKQDFQNWINDLRKEYKNNYVNGYVIYKGLSTQKERRENRRKMLETAHNIFNIFINFTQKFINVLEEEIINKNDAALLLTKLDSIKNFKLPSLLNFKDNLEKLLNDISLLYVDLGKNMLVLIQKQINEMPIEANSSEEVNNPETANFSMK